VKQRLSRPGRRLAIPLLAALCAVATPATAQQTRLNYVNADVRDVIRSLATVMGVNVLISEEVPAKRVTYTTPAPVPAEQVGAVLEAILESEGLVLVQRGPVAEVMPAANAPATGPIGFGKELPSPPPLGLITQIVPLQYIRAEEGLAVLQQLASPTARVETVPRSNSLLITDRGINVARYLELLVQLDVRSDGEGGLRTYVYRLKHASGPELAATLAQIFGASVPAVQSRPRVDALADRSLSRTLESFRQRELQSLEQRRDMLLPLELQPAAGDSAAAAEALAGLVGETTIVPDLATNSLVIRTAPPNYPVLEETIAALDVRPAQVLLEVLVAEIALDDRLEYGINWSIFADSVSGGNTSLLGRLGPSVPDSALSLIDDFSLRVVRLNSVDVRAVVRALASEANVQVLSTPHILALNNEEARILVGSEVPFSQSTRTGLDVVVDRIVQYRNVGTELTIIPTINEDGYVTFRILQQVSNLTEQTVPAALGAPIISTREAETSALVLNGQTVVIGGLIDEQSFDVESGVPLLKDIPLLGYLFKSKSTRRIRTELAIFVTPYVVFTDDDAADLLERERERLRNEVLQQALPPPDTTSQY
jgi:general secretion pathway protein D